MPLDVAKVEEIIQCGGTILGTSRTNPYKKDRGVEKCLEHFKKWNLRALVVMGGEDTLGVAAKLFKDKKLPVVGVPKTMDNDLPATDYTFGFDTASSVAVEAAERLRDTGRSHRRIMVLEVMGRHAGWVALFTGIASGADWICVPERPVDVKQMSEHLIRAHARKKYALVVASEAVDLQGTERRKGDLDEFGHNILKERGVGEALAKIIQKETGIETRSAVIGHIQRGGSPTLFDRILATRVGVEAFRCVLKGEFGKMTALRGNQVCPVPLEEATASIKTVSKEWLDLADQLRP